MTPLFALLVFASTANAAPSPTTYSSCAKFDANLLLEDATSAKEKANAYLDGALYRLEESDEARGSPEVTRQRDACVELALKNGADPNNAAYYKAPLLMAIDDKDDVAVKLLLSYHASLSAQARPAGTDQSVPLLVQACGSGNDDLAAALLSQGADPNAGEPLWLCAASAEDRTVAALLQSGKVPVNQLSSFGDSVFGDDRQTALDASEQRLQALKAFQAKYVSSPDSPAPLASAADKLAAANQLLYTYYVGQIQIAAKEDPLAVLSALTERQSRVSELLKAAGWACHLKNCGI